MILQILDDVPPPPTADPRLHALYAYWNAKRGARRFPARADIDPVEIPHLLPFLSMADVRAQAPRFVYRLVGTKLVDMLRHELTGKPVGTGVKEAALGSVLARYDRVADGGLPLYHRDLMHEKDNDFTGVDRLMLPLGPDGGAVTVIFSIVVPLLGD